MGTWEQKTFRPVAVAPVHFLVPLPGMVVKEEQLLLGQKSLKTPGSFKKW